MTILKAFLPGMWLGATSGVRVKKPPGVLYGSSEGIQLFFAPTSHVMQIKDLSDEHHLSAEDLSKTQAMSASFQCPFQSAL